MPAPDLRTLEGATDFLDYHAPNEEAQMKHRSVNAWFQTLLRSTWDHLPEGPGKTVAIRAMNEARMACNSCIANDGG